MLQYGCPAVEALESRTLFTSLVRVVDLGAFNSSQVPLEPAVVKAGSSYYFTGPGSTEKTVWKSTGLGGAPMTLKDASGNVHFLSGKILLHPNGSGIVIHVREWAQLSQIDANGNLTRINRSDESVEAISAGGRTFVWGDWNPGNAYETYLVSLSGKTKYRIVGKGQESRPERPMITTPIIEHEGKLYCTGFDGLWRLDGLNTASPYAQLMGFEGGITQLKSAAGKIYFASGDRFSRQWYESDGEGAVKRLSESLSLKLLCPPVSYKGATWFVAGDGLYRGDGTDAGTQRMVSFDLHEAANLQVVGERLLFTSDTKLYASDGTKAGTILLKDFAGMSSYGETYSEWNDPFAGASFIAKGGKIFFVANDPATGWELWETDGSVNGTKVHDLRPGVEGSGPLGLADAGGTLFFKAKSDGKNWSVYRIRTSDTNTKPVARVKTSLALSEGASLTLDASTSTDADTDPLVYAWDLNGDGVFGDVRTSGAVTSVPWATLQTLGITDGPATFNARVQVSDGLLSARSPAVTLRVNNAAPKIEARGPAQAVQGVKYFVELVATDPSPDTVTHWKLDWGDGESIDVDAASVQLHHVYPTKGNYTRKFTARDEDGTYSSSRTLSVIAKPTTVLPLPVDQHNFYYDLNGSAIYPTAIELDGLTIFTASSSKRGTEIWRSDGTSAGTAMLKDLYGGMESSLPCAFVRAGKAVYFYARDRKGEGIYRTDGTMEGTYALVRKRGVQPGSFVVFGNTLYFTVRDPLRRSVSLYALLEDGAQIVADVTGVPLRDMQQPVATRGSLFAVANRSDEKAGLSLWKISGALAEEVTVVSSSRGVRMLPTSSRLFIEVGSTTREAGFTLMTDGTTKGTLRVRSNVPGYDSATYENGIARIVADRYYTGATALGSDDKTSGRELFTITSKGNAILLKDINKGADDTWFTFVGAHQNVAFFTASGDTSPSLWRTDGTAEGTTRLGEYSLQQSRYEDSFEKHVSISAADGCYFVAAAKGDAYMRLYRVSASDSLPVAITKLGKQLNLRAFGASGSKIVLAYGASGLPAAWYSIDRKSGAMSSLTDAALPAVAAMEWSDLLTVLPENDRLAWLQHDSSYDGRTIYRMPA